MQVPITGWHSSMDVTAKNSKPAGQLVVLSTAVCHTDNTVHTAASIQLHNSMLVQQKMNRTLPEEEHILSRVSVQMLKNCSTAHLFLHAEPPTHDQLYHKHCSAACQQKWIDFSIRSDHSEKTVSRLVPACFRTSYHDYDGWQHCHQPRWQQCRRRLFICSAFTSNNPPMVVLSASAHSINCSLLHLSHALSLSMFHSLSIE